MREKVVGFLWARQSRLVLLDANSPGCPCWSRFINTAKICWHGRWSLTRQRRGREAHQRGSQRKIEPVSQKSWAVTP